MTAVRRVLAMHDADAFGGHEIMLFRLLPGLLDDPRLTGLAFAYPAANTELDRRLRALGHPKLHLLPWRWLKRPAEPYLAPLRLGYARAVRQLYRQERPDVVLLVQGRIENCVVPMRALPTSARIVSYVPMAHGLAELERGALIGDAVRRPLYRRPQRFVVPSDAVAAQVVRAGGTGEIRVAPNLVDPAAAIARDEARARLGLPAAARIALFVGRFDVRQKGLDLLCAAIARGRGALAGWTFLFVGEGEGSAAIARLAAEVPGGVDILVHGFTRDVPAYLAAAEVVLLPSRWEGDPLVMLEAMEHDRPILSSRIDVFTDALPPASRVDYATVDLAVALAAVTAPTAIADYRAAAGRRLATGSLDRSRAAFADAVLG